MQTCFKLDEGGKTTKQQTNNQFGDAILRLRNSIITMYFYRYLSCFGIKIQIILANLYKLKIEY